MRKALMPAFLLLLGSAVLGATVFHEPLAHAAQSIFISNDASQPVPVREQNLDAGNIRVHEEGTANVNVNGNVPTRAAIPATQFSRSFTTSATPFPLSGPDPAGRNYAITSISLSNTRDEPGGVVLDAEYGTTGNCSNFEGDPNVSGGPSAVVPGHDTVSMTFPQPFVIEAKPGASSCLSAFGVSGTGVGAQVTVVGYHF